MNHPRSTISSIICYLPVGIAVVVTGLNWLFIVAGAAVMILGVASAWYHASEHRWARHWDIISIYGAFSLLFAAGLSTFPSFAPHMWLLALMGISFPFLVWVTYSDWSHTQIGFAAIMNLMVLLVRTDLDWERFAGTTALYLAGLFIGNLAERKPKYTRHYDNLHSARHLIWALAILLTGL